jgi:hypothetical protein
MFVCREFVLFFSVIDEGSSLYLARNMANFLPALAGGNTVVTQTSTDEARGVRAQPLLTTSLLSLSFVRADALGFHVCSVL